MVAAAQAIEDTAWQLARLQARIDWQGMLAETAQAELTRMLRQAAELVDELPRV